MQNNNLISFPLRSNLPITPELIQEWASGLSSKDYAKQWRAFERMSNFSDIHVLGLIQDFLLQDSGEPLLKTRLLQTLKKTCPTTLSFEVEKKGERRVIKLAEVPVHLEDWPVEYIHPLTTLEEKAYADPSLIELARELWLFFLEKNYPFYPDMSQELAWSASLHIHTLATINEELANEQIKKELPRQYGYSAEELVQFYRRFIEQLA